MYPCVAWWSFCCYGLQVWYFPCNQWLDAQRGDGSTRRTLTATTSFDPDSLLARYRVAITTGNLRGAGTDAQVSISICGTMGDTGPKVVNPPAAAGRDGRLSAHMGLERGSTLEVTVLGVDVGSMSQIVIGHDGSGLSPAWYLERVEVEHMGTGQVLVFTASR